VLVGLVAFESQMSPFSIHVPTLFAEDSGKVSGMLHRGTVCRWTGGRLSLGPFVVDLGSADHWSGLLTSVLIGEFVDPGTTLDRLECALGIAGADGGLREIVIPSSTPTVFGRKAKEVLDRIEQQRESNGDRLTGLSGLVGLGIGFTPSGDDFISGLLLAHEMTGETGVAIDRQEIRSSLSKTNYGGKTLLTGALENRFPDYLLRFAEELSVSQSAGRSNVDSGNRAVLEAVRNAVTYGETSGTDAVTGIVWYLRFTVGSPAERPQTLFVIS
jgi:hypothetical protein